MAKNIGDISVGYRAEIKDFVGKTGKVERLIGNFTTSAKRKFKAMGKALKGALNPKALFAGAIGGTLFGKMFSDTSKYSEELVEASRVAEISIGKFERLREVLKGDGMALEEATSATRRFAKRIGEVRLLDRGTFFKGLESISEKFPDLSAKLFESVKDKSQSPLQVLNEMVEFAREAKLSASEVAALFDLGLGLQGRKMGITLVNAAKEHGNLKKAMDEYGKYITMTPEEHLQNKATGQDFTNMASNIADGVRKIMSAMAEPIQDVIQKFNAWLLDLKNDPEKMQGLVDKFKTILEGIINAAKAIGTIINAASALIDKLPASWLTDTPEPTPQTNNPRTGRAAPRTRTINETPVTPKPVYKNPLEGMDGGAASFSSISDQIYQRMKAENMVASVGGIGSSIRNTGNIDPPKGLTASGIVAVGGDTNIMQSLNDLRPTVEELNHSFRSLINAMLDGQSSFSDILNGLLDSIMQRAIVDPVADWATKGVNAFFGGIFGGARANGGMARGMTLVGERGPELVDFSRPGMVYSNERLSAALAGGGRGTTIHYNINSTDGPGVRAALAEATPGIVAAANQQMIEETNRVGSTRTIMQGRR